MVVISRLLRSLVVGFTLSRDVSFFSWALEVWSRILASVV